MERITPKLEGNIPSELTGVESIQFVTDHTPASHSEGKIYYDPSNKTLSIMRDILDVILQAGEENQIRVHNDTGLEIPNGTVVYQTGINGGGVPTVAPAIATSEATSRAFGMTTNAIDDGENGYITNVGLVRGLNTNALNEDTAWISASVAGEVTNTEPEPPNFSVEIGSVLVKDASDGVILVNINRGANTPQTLVFTLPLRGVVDTSLNLTGEFRTVAAAQTTDYATDFAVSNNHAFILVNTITGTGTITITGTSINETTAVSTIGDTEVITIDATAAQYYQSSKKWWDITNIAISGPSAINYDIGVVGYTDINNQNFTLLSYRLDMVSQGADADIRLQIIKVKDDGAGKMSLVYVEDIGVDDNAAGDQIIDHLRTGGDDRSYNGPTNVWEDNTTFVFKQGDFDTYFTADENVFLSGDNHEGLIIRFEGEGAGITNVDFASLQIRYRPL